MHFSAHSNRFQVYAIFSIWQFIVELQTGEPTGCPQADQIDVCHTRLHDAGTGSGEPTGCPQADQIDVRHTCPHDADTGCVSSHQVDDRDSTKIGCHNAEKKRILKLCQDNNLRFIQPPPGLSPHKGSQSADQIVVCHTHPHDAGMGSVSSHQVDDQESLTIKCIKFNQAAINLGLKLKFSDDEGYESGSVASGPEEPFEGLSPPAA